MHGVLNILQITVLALVVCEEGVETLEAPLVIVLKKVREMERGREKGYGCINFSAQTAPSSSIFLFCQWRVGRYNYTVKRAGVAAGPKTSIWARVWVREYKLWREI